MKTYSLVAALLVGVAVSLSGQGPRRVPLGDWPEARGPNRDGTSADMDSYAAQITEAEMWNLVDYVRSLGSEASGR